MFKTWFFFSLLQLALVGSAFCHCLGMQRLIQRYPELIDDELRLAKQQQIRAGTACGLAVLFAGYIWQHNHNVLIAWLFIATGAGTLVNLILYRWHVTWLRNLPRRPAEDL